jgi:hypothetical protein
MITTNQQRLDTLAAEQDRVSPDFVPHSFFFLLVPAIGKGTTASMHVTALKQRVRQERQIITNKSKAPLLQNDQPI